MKLTKKKIKKAVNALESFLTPYFDLTNGDGNATLYVYVWDPGFRGVHIDEIGVRGATGELVGSPVVREDVINEVAGAATLLLAAESWLVAWLALRDKGTDFYRRAQARVVMDSATKQIDGFFKYVERHAKHKR